MPLGPCVFLTGATGFLGKVVLEELLRKSELGLLPGLKVVILLRDTVKNDAYIRFLRLTESKCFSKLQPGWTDHVEVIRGDLTSKCCGLNPDEYQVITRKVTHIIHCAASVDFHLPIQEAANANITSCLNVVDLSEDCTNLCKMVFVSTAYVRPHKLGLLTTDLVPLPAPAEDLYASILSGRMDEKDLLLRSGHTNTYTLTKCIAEHLTHNRSGRVPLSIVRPSIISAAWKYPFPAWIDSWAAFAGCAALYGSGFMHVLEGDMDTVYDIIPVDIVAEDIIRELALCDYRVMQTSGAPPAYHLGAQIRHSTVGTDCNMRGRIILDIMTRYFSENTVYKKPFLSYHGPKCFALSWYQMTRQTIPLKAAESFFWLTKNRLMRKRLSVMRRSIKNAARSFPYFASHTFDFDTPRRLHNDFNSAEYLDLICVGVHRHLLLGDK